MAGCCSSCAIGSPHAAMLREERRMGDLLPKVVWPADNEEIKRHIDVAVKATAAAVAGCAALTAEERAAWDRWAADWEKFRREPVPTFGGSNVFERAQDFQAELSRYQTQLRAKCKIPGPEVVDPRAQTEEGAAAASALKWVAAAVIVAGVAYGLRTVLR